MGQNNLTKEQVIDLVRHVDGLLISSNGGEGFVHGGCECVEFADWLETLYFEGEVEPVPDISNSPYYAPEWPTYKFSAHDCDTTDSDIYINIGEMFIEE